METEHIYKKVEKIVFGFLSPKQIKKMATVKVVTPELYDKDGYPVDGGLMDTRMGVIDPGLRCPVDGKKLKECPGYFGYIELARPVIHIQYTKIILDLLRSTCGECGRILMEESEIEETIKHLDCVEKESGLNIKRKKIKAIIASLKTVKKCPHCRAKQYNIKIEKPLTFIENDKKLTPIDIRSRFEKTPDRDVEVIGLNPRVARPEWLILTLLPIPPVTMRPSITLDTGERSEDDLTHKLSDIVRINQRLFENINAGAPEVIVEDLWDLLQYHVTTYFDNTVSQIPPARHRSGQALKTLTERIKSKEGRFRYNLAGKRVNFAARTVISPDPEIAFNEVGVPRAIANELTVPERVNEWNLERLKEFIKRGPEEYPGANYVIRPDGKKKKISDETKEQLLEELQPGYLVERHIMDGDIAIFNRQPSLHRMSIMSHKIKILPYKSFRLNPAVCTPYAGDFDGDEMNLHIPQTEEARAEAEILMHVQTQIITPKNGTNIIGCLEDAISGNYLLTKGLEFNKDEAVELLMSVGIKDIPKFGKIVNGKEIFSALLPNNFEYIGKSRDDEDVIIKNGKLIKGIIDGASIGEENGNLIRKLHRDYGEDKTLELMGLMFKLGIKTLLYCGFTSGLADTDLNPELKSKIQKMLNDAEKQVEELIRKYKAGQITPMSTKTLEESLELMILQVLNKVRNKIGEVVAANAPEKNSFIIMSRSGARGNVLNLAMMSAVVGQQSLKGKRIENGYGDRTLSVFNKNDLSPRARGFIRSSYKKGLDPVEFFFGSMTGRDSLMDTALRTPKSGYLYRRLSNALQDLKIEYDYTVRDANKAIIQFNYGDDGMDVSKSEGGTINIKNLIKEVILK